MSRSVLIDSHVFLWAAQDVSRLQPPARRALSEALVLHISVVSVAELCVKSANGKLLLPREIERDPAAGFQKQADDMGAVILPLDLAACAALKALPLHHRDPFDRLLIAQALTQGLTVVTHDRAFAAYEGLDIVWT